MLPTMTITHCHFDYADKQVHFLFYFVQLCLSICKHVFGHFPTNCSCSIQQYLQNPKASNSSRPAGETKTTNTIKYKYISLFLQRAPQLNPETLRRTSIVQMRPQGPRGTHHGAWAAVDPGLRRLSKGMFCLTGWGEGEVIQPQREGDI